MKSIKIQIPSIKDNIRIVESFIDNAREKFSFTDDIYGNIMIAVTESVNNAIKHGNANDSSKSVLLELSFQENIIKFSITDEGLGFNYADLPDPTSPENLEKPGGRGIFLMRHLCDEVNFLKNGTQVELSFYFN